RGGRHRGGDGYARTGGAARFVVHGALSAAGARGRPVARLRRGTLTADIRSAETDRPEGQDRLEGHPMTKTLRRGLVLTTALLLAPLSRPGYPAVPASPASASTQVPFEQVVDQLSS